MASKFTATGAPATPQTQLDPRPGPLVDPAADLSPAEVERYSRHLIIPEIGATGQRRLKNAKVLVIGAGAPVAVNLEAILQSMPEDTARSYYPRVRCN